MDLDDGLSQLFRRVDRLRVRLEIALGGDEVHKFLGDIDVGCFKRACLNGPKPVIARLAKGGLSRDRRRDIVGVADLLQPVGVSKIRDHDFAERRSLSVCIVRPDRAARVDVEAIEAARRISVL